MRAIKRLVLVKLLASVAFATGACVPMAVEQHGGLSPVPSKVTDAEFAGIGATFDAALLAAKVPVVPRVLADVLAAWSIRNVSTFGRSVDSGFLFTLGVFPVEWTHGLVHGLQHPSHPACYKYVGPDTMVTTATVLPAVKGWRWGNECLTWPEIRALRHE